MDLSSQPCFITRGELCHQTFCGANGLIFGSARLVNGLLIVPINFCLGVPWLPSYSAATLRAGSLVSMVSLASEVEDDDSGAGQQHLPLSETVVERWTVAMVRGSTNHQVGESQNR